VHRINNKIVNHKAKLVTYLIPKSEWKNITHIFVTHGDIDHYWHTDRVAEASNAPVICNKTTVRNIILLMIKCLKPK
jgi:flavorubredoxin